MECVRCCLEGVPGLSAGDSGGTPPCQSCGIRVPQIRKLEVRIPLFGPIGAVLGTRYRCAAPPRAVCSLFQDCVPKGDAEDAPEVCAVVVISGPEMDRRPSTARFWTRFRAACPFGRGSHATAVFPLLAMSGLEILLCRSLFEQETGGDYLI